MTWADVDQVKDLIFVRGKLISVHLLLLYKVSASFTVLNVILVTQGVEHPHAEWTKMGSQCNLTTAASSSQHLSLPAYSIWRTGNEKVLYMSDLCRLLLSCIPVL